MTESQNIHPPLRLLIFGGRGFVGGIVARTARQRGWGVCIADTCAGPEVPAQQVDITDALAVERAIETVRPAAVVNVAAIADIDRAERDQVLAYRVNVDGARHIAERCARRGLRYVFFSSDAVFSGEAGPYGEDDPPAPLNYYGQTKAQAEQAVLQACPAAAVIRISLVLGYPVAGGNAFFTHLEEKLKRGAPLAFPTAEIRTPVDVATLAECVLELCQNDYAGVLHIGATGSLSRYALAQELARRMGFDPALVRPQPPGAAAPGRAPRHRNGILRVGRARQVLRTPFPGLDETIDRAFTPAPPG